MEKKDSLFNNGYWGIWSLTFRDGETEIQEDLPGTRALSGPASRPPDLASAHPLPDVQHSRNPACRGALGHPDLVPEQRFSRPAWVSETETTFWTEGWEGS